MKTSVIVPAYNEAERITSVLTALSEAEEPDELIVVDDGSTDGTSQVVEDFQVNVNLITLQQNMGKFKALAEGIRESSGQVLMFIDADLIGLQADHVDSMILTYQEGNWDMVIGVFHNGRLKTDISQKISPHLSGQRILSRDIWQQLNKTAAEEFGVEMALTKFSLKKDLNTRRVKLTGVTHVMKEEKRGLTSGIKSRLKMYRDIIKTTFTPVKFK